MSVYDYISPSVAEFRARQASLNLLNFFLREKEVRQGLVVEGEGGRLGLVLVVICLRLHIPFSSGVPS